MKHTLLRSRLPWLLALVALLAGFLIPAGATLAQEDDPSAVLFSGVIEAITPDSWTIGGQDVAIDGDTLVVITTGNAEVGMWADVRAKREEDDSLTGRRIAVIPPEMRLRGEVTVIPAGLLGEWTIGGQIFLVDADTQIGNRGGPVAVGAWVQVAAVQEGDVLRAVRIRTIDPLSHVEVVGAIQAFDATSWTISGVQLALDGDTLIQGAPAVGLLANGGAEQQPDDSLLALRLRVKWEEFSGPHPPVTVTGVIEELPPDGLTGRWVVDGHNVAVLRNTLIDQRNGLAVVGAEVRIEGRQNGDAVVAREIVVITSPEPGLERVRFSGPIRRLPDHGLMGVWMVDGHAVRVNESTRIVGERFVRVGAIARVWGIVKPDGTVVATTIAVRPPRPGEATATPGEATITPVQD